ncbi:hypothetical protein MPSEU_000701200 [Mayamaea pseudoterrestris]|nr:hypothetical protein MPSEU_000701200 [Mayamaea pseudoterrestris]
MATSSEATTAVEDGNSINLQEMQETVSRLSSHKGVQMVLILNRSGDIMVESGSNHNGPTHAKNVQKLMDAANLYFQTTDADDKVSFMQLRSKDNYELMISPHEGYVLAVLKR